jgi:hypothetical protein
LRYQKTAVMMRPPMTTMDMRPLRDRPQPSTPAGRPARIWEKILTARPEKMRATLAPRPNRG